jgi:iron complex transport system substrate-binding protein
MVVVMPCGYSIDRTINELMRFGRAQEAWQRATESWPDIYVVDAGSYFSRPGPRLVEGVELLAAILHPSHDRQIDHTKAIKLEASTLVGDCTP